MKAGLRAKFGIFFLLYGIAMVAAIWLMMFLFFEDRFIEYYTDSLETMVGITAEGLELSAEQIESYAKSGRCDERYWEIYHKMKRIQQNTNLAYIYVIYPTSEHEAVWVFDTTENGAGLSEPVTEYGMEKYRTAREVCASGEMQHDSGVMDTESQELISIYYPIGDENGNTIAILGEDIYLDEIRQVLTKSLLSVTVQIIAAMAVGMLLLLTMVRFVVICSIDNLKAGVKRMAEGELGVQVACRRRDEIGDITAAFNRMSERLGGHVKEMEELNRACQRFLSPETFAILQKESVAEIGLGDLAEAKLTVLSMEPCRFREKTKRMSPAETFGYINGILDGLIPSVLKQGGTIAKFEKAGLCSFYRVCAKEALNSALNSCETLRAKGERLRAGIAYGTVIVGIAGQEERMNILSLSEQIKISAFLMKIAPKYYASILISGAAAAQVPKMRTSYHTRFLGYLKEETAGRLFAIYDVFDADEPEDRRFKQITKERFEQGVSLFCAGNYTEARGAFIEVLKQNRKDKAAGHYLGLCSRYLKECETEGSVWIEVV